MKKKIIKRILISIFVIPILLITVAVAVLYCKQDAIVKELLTNVNKDFNAEIKIGDSHIAPFAGFPYISLDIDDLKIYPNKLQNQQPIISLKDVYVGFDLFKLISGKIDIKTIKLKDGFIHAIQDTTGQINIMEAFASNKPADKPLESLEEEFHLHLQSLKLEKVDVTYLDKKTKTTIETFIAKAQTAFKASNNHTLVDLNTNVVLNVITDKDTSFFKHKHIKINTKLDLFNKENNLVISPSEIELEHALFNFEGKVNLDGDMDADLKIIGNKPNFDLFLAFAPEELAPVLKQFDNKGKIYFKADIKGKLLHEHLPLINVDFGCEHAFLHNTTTDKKLDDLNFKAHFTNHGKRGLEAMEFSLTDFSSRPEAGLFTGFLKLKNFAAPEIDTKIISDFDLDFLAKFLNADGLKDLKGKVKLTLNFKDIIDFAHPEKAIEKLNESYFTELIVNNLSFGSNAFHVPVNNVNINATLKGHAFEIKRFDARIGKSDIKVSGHISDLPAIIHHTKDQVTCDLNFQSKLLDVYELTANDTLKAKPVNEKLNNFSMQLRFKSSAKAFTESPNLPVGEFFIDDLHVDFKNYPHKLTNFRADLFIDSSNFKIIDFSGLIDKSDFHFNGKLHHYDLWFQNTPAGDTKLEFDLTSKFLQLHDVFSYNGENYVPEDYRHEEFDDLKLHGHVDLHFKESLKSTDLYLEEFTAKMKLHKYKFEKFKGRVHYQDEHLMVQDFFAKIGNSSFEIDLNYYLGKDLTIKKRDNHFGITANYLDMDELFAYTVTPTATKTVTPNQHDQGFSIYDVPFTDMTFDLNIAHLQYHKYLLNNFVAKARTTQNHYIYIDTLKTQIADGALNMRGYFNGSDKNKIYFSPVMKMKNIDLDKLLIKFDNFGQDAIVSDNIHGKLSGTINGKIHVHRDMVPIIDDSEIHMDLQITEGRLDKFEPIAAMTEYFKDKNTNKVKFDTLQNHIDMLNGEISFPNMTINSSLGFIEIQGKQDMKMNMEYVFRIPMKMITDVAKSKLFGGKNETPVDEEQEDDIQYKDENKRTRFMNIKLVGKDGKYKVSMAKSPDKKK
jgi:hypothetical protein